MATVHLLHGFNVRDGGQGTTAKWARILEREGFDAYPHNLGLIGLINLRCRNKALVDELLPLIKPGDIIVAHSNGCTITWLLIQAGARPGAVVCVNAALRRSTRWPDSLPVLNLHSSEDDVLKWGRRWRILVGGDHLWGMAGRCGFNPAAGKQVSNIDMAEAWWEHPVKSHSGAFDTDYWAEHTAQWLKILKREKQLCTVRDV